MQGFYRKHLFSTVAATCFLSMGVNHSVFALLENVPAADCSVPSNPNTYYIAPYGNDNNPGTLSQPFLTVQRAANVARPGETVILRAGTYRETVKPVCSGVAGKPITYTVYPNEKAVINGTNIVTGWAAFSGPIYKAQVNTDLGVGANQVFVNGQLLFDAQWPAPTANDFSDLSRPEARSTFENGSPPVYVPNSNSMFATSSIDNNLAPPALKYGDTWNKANIHVQARYNSMYLFGYVTNLQAANGSTPGKINYQVKGEGTDPNKSYNQKIYASPGNKYYLTGLLSLLTAPGEWFYNSNSKTLFLRTLTDQNPSSMLVEAKARQFGFDLTQRSYIILKGINFFATGIQSNYSAYYPTSSHLTLDGITAEYISQQAALPSIFATPVAGIRLFGNNDVLKNSTIAYSGNVGVYLYGNNSQVTNNVIHDVNYNADTPDGAISTFLSKNQISNNTLYNAGYSLVYANYLQSTKILNNIIHDAMLQTEDGGNIYITGPDGVATQVAENIIYNLSFNPVATAIYFDNNSRNFLVNNNLVVNANTALGLNAPSDPNIKQVNIKVYNNTLVPYCDDCVGVNSYTPLSVSTLQGVELKNNIIIRKITMKKNMLSPVELQPVYQNNLFSTQLTQDVYNYLNTPGNSNTGNLYSTTSDISPKFVSPYPNGFNYSLMPTSPGYKLSTAIPTTLNIGPYTIPFVGIAAGAPAGACGSVPAWKAGATLPGFSPIRGCG